MATESTPAPAKEPPKNGKKDSDKHSKGSKEEPTEGAPKQLTGAEKKALQKAEKAARRAQTKAAAPPPKDAGDHKGAKKSKGDASGPVAAGLGGGSGGPAGLGGPVKATGPIPEAKPQVPESFSHLSMARRIPISQADKDVHPAVLALGQHMASFALTDPIGRLHGTLLALKKVVDDYVTPQGSSFSRHFTPHVLNPQVEYLSTCRPMSFCMGNAIRWLKAAIIEIDVDVDDVEAKKTLQAKIDDFIDEKIILSDQVILDQGRNQIRSGDVILTFSRHRLVESVLRSAHLVQRKQFEVVIIDDPVDKEGMALAEILARDGVKVSYYPTLGGIQFILARATKAMLGAEAMFHSGSMYARSGTSDVALCAADHELPVVALCHSINFTDRVAMDSLTYNEIDPDRHTESNFRLLFDTTKDKHLTVIVTDQGNAAAKSSASVVRRWQDRETQ